MPVVHRLLPALAVTCITACTLAAPDRPVADLSLRLIADEGCEECVAIRDPRAPDPAFRIRVHNRPLVASADIEGLHLLQNADGTCGFDAALRSQASARVAKASADAVGQAAAWTVGDDLLTVVRITTPFDTRTQTFLGHDLDACKAKYARITVNTRR